MMIYWKHFKSTIRHKYFVFIAGRKLGVNLWQLLIHDWVKFLPCEFIPYAKYFYGGKHNPNEFAYAWLHHTTQPHHPEYWQLDNEYNFGIAKDGLFPMPEKYVREMIADWLGAGMEYQQSWDMTGWIEHELPKKKMHPETWNRVYEILKEIDNGKIFI